MKELVSAYIKILGVQISSVCFPKAPAECPGS